MSEIVKHWIDGEWTGSGTVSESVNPATGAVLGRWADGGEAEARAAVAAARRAFDTSPWSRDRSLRHRASREIHAGTIWTNRWAAINDGFAEGGYKRGYKQSGIGRLRGPLAITEFTEAKTVVHAIPPFQV
jgi:acyl-CoA reductase-like NAD-dependent aldehyde dehydrogenase